MGKIIGQNRLDRVVCQLRSILLVCYVISDTCKIRIIIALAINFISAILDSDLIFLILTKSRSIRL